jgi:hypothetical protein
MIVILLSDRGSQHSKLPLRRLHSCHPLALLIRSVLLDAAAQAPAVSQRVAALRRWCSFQTPISRADHQDPKYTFCSREPVGVSILSLSCFFIGVSFIVGLIKSYVGVLVGF